MATKFCRTLIFTGTTNGAPKATYPLKAIYEFWGYSINGTASLTVPGGFATTTPFGGGLPGDFQGLFTTIAVGSNGQTLPQAVIAVASTTGFAASGTIYVFTTLGTQTVTYTNIVGNTFTGCSGGAGVMSTGNNVTSPSLLTFGNDGYTNQTTNFQFSGTQNFFAASQPFTSAMVGKTLVTWKAGSGSSEDGLYNIIGFVSPTQIQVNVNNGGTPSAPDGYKPSFTNRTSINYRVVDMGISGATTGVADGNFMVMQFDPTGVNAGQANSQVQLIIASTNGRIDHRISPAGTWNGTTFSDATTQTAPNTVSTNTFFNGSSGGTTQQITLIGDKDFLIGHYRDTNNPQGTPGIVFHLEIPDRLYTLAQDPNPVVVNFNGFGTAVQFPSTSTTHTYGGGWVMKCNDGTARTHRCSVRSLSGDGNANLSLTTAADTPGNNLDDFRAGANAVTGNLLNSPGFLTLPGVAGQYSLARVRLRRVRFANIFMPQFTRFNTSSGDFILITQGVAIPWDKSVLPYTLFPF
jgi:hypothetical protein